MKIFFACGVAPMPVPKIKCLHNYRMQEKKRGEAEGDNNEEYHNNNDD